MVKYSLSAGLIASAALLALAAPSLADQAAYHYSTSLYSTTYAKDLWVTTKMPGANGGQGAIYLKGYGGINNYPFNVGVRYYTSSPSLCFYEYWNDSDFSYHTDTPYSGGDVCTAGTDMNIEELRTATGTWHARWNSFNTSKVVDFLSLSHDYMNTGYVRIDGWGCNATTTNSYNHPWWTCEFQNDSGTWFYWPTSSANTVTGSCTTTPRYSGNVGSGGTAYTAVY